MRSRRARRRAARRDAHAGRRAASVASHAGRSQRPIVGRFVVEGDGLRAEVQTDERGTPNSLGNRRATSAFIATSALALGASRRRYGFVLSITPRYSASHPEPFALCVKVDIAKHGPSSGRPAPLLARGSHCTCARRGEQGRVELLPCSRARETASSPVGPVTANGGSNLTLPRTAAGSGP